LQRGGERVQTALRAIEMTRAKRRPTRAVRIAVALAVALSPLVALGCRNDARDLGPAPPPSAKAAREVRYVALGDSFTIGTGSSPDEAFPARLAERFRAAGLTVSLRNLGVNGYSSQEVIDRELPEAIAFAPTLVTLAIGANDWVRGVDVETYRAHERTILEALVAGGIPAGRIVTLPQPDWSRSPAARAFGEPKTIAAAIEQYNGVLREESLRVKARYIDLFPLMQREAEAGLVAGDGLHPSARAHDEWAAELSRSIAP
jgi:lysophospholipase L1-like esterase